MSETFTYYAVLREGATRDAPSGLARRVHTEEGFRDEVLYRDFNWRFNPLVAEWKRAESSEDLVEISEAEAERLIERFRGTW